MPLIAKFITEEPANEERGQFYTIGYSDILVPKPVSENSMYNIGNALCRRFNIEETSEDDHYVKFRCYFGEDIPAFTINDIFNNIKNMQENIADIIDLVGIPDYKIEFVIEVMS